MSATRSSPSSASAFDLSHIGDQWGGPEDELYRAILNIFADEGHKLCRDARIFFQRGEREALARTAHTLAGASANVGALRLASSAGQLEAAMEAGQTHAVEELVRGIESAWLEVQSQIAQGGPTADDR